MWRRAWRPFLLPNFFFRPSVRAAACETRGRRAGGDGGRRADDKDKSWRAAAERQACRSCADVAVCCAVVLRNKGGTSAGFALAMG
jgi:hypothetical protein